MVLGRLFSLMVFFTVHLYSHNLNEIMECIQTGLVIDFAVIKEKTAVIIKELDHKFLNDLHPFKEHNPSSENIAQYIAERLSSELNNATLQVTRVSAWESDPACATYYMPMSPLRR